MRNDEIVAVPLSSEGSEPPDLPLDAVPPPLKRRPRIWPTFVVPLLGLLLAVVLQGILGALVAVQMLANGVDRSELEAQIMAWLTTPGGFMALLACGQVGFAVPTILAGLLSPEPFRQRLGLVPLHDAIRVSAMTALGSLLPLAISIGLAYLVLQFDPADASFEKFFEQLTLAWGVVFVVTIALAPGFIEEMLFRGYVQRRLLERWRPAWAIGVASLLFTLAHVTPTAMAVALPLGVWFGVIAWRVGSIVPTIVCHAFINGGVNTWRLLVKFAELSETTQLVSSAFFVIVGVVCFVLSCRMLAEYPSPTSSQTADQLAGIAQ